MLWKNAITFCTVPTSCMPKATAPIAPPATSILAVVLLNVLQVRVAALRCQAGLKKLPIELAVKGQATLRSGASGRRTVSQSPGLHRAAKHAHRLDHTRKNDQMMRAR